MQTPIAIQKIEKLLNIHIPSVDSKQNEFPNIAYSVENGYITRISLANCALSNLDIFTGLYKDFSRTTHLNLNGNKIEDLSDIHAFKSLENLSINSNRVRKITGIIFPKKLNYLRINDNRISEIPSLENVANVRDLFLDDNRIQDISAIAHLKKIKILSLKNNNIKDIRVFEGQKTVEILILDGNKITDIEPLQHLSNIQLIGLRNNPITMLPKWVANSKLDIFWNDDLDMWKFGYNFFDNPLVKPSPAIVQEGRQAIKRYFQRIETEGVDYIYEAKLILVGEGSAGKTSLQVRLLNSRAALPKKESRTRGIKIHDWKFRKEKNKQAIAHIWDFGGQDVYYPVHRFFLTENSVFVLLASTRQTHHNFDYWIPTIYQFGGKSPIVLGQTCHDGNKIPWTDLGYFVANTDFNIVRASDLFYLELNLINNNEGLEKIKTAIIYQLTNLPHYGKGVPKSYIPVRERIALESVRTACISYEKFAELCRQLDADSFQQQVDVEDCGRFFHSIGVILWYYNNDVLKDWIVLQPEWAMNAVYKIIDDSTVQNIQKGIIKSTDFGRLWNEHSYKAKHTTLKNMLQVFKIAFEKKHPKGDYIIPARLQSIPHEAKWKNDEPYLRLEYQYEFMPKGLVNQVSAELGRYIGCTDKGEESVWNNAVTFQNNSTFCQVQEDFYNRKISILAKGKDARGLVILVMDALKNITEDYRGVKPMVNVPCTCSECKTNNNPTLFPHDKLVAWSEKKDTVMCNESGETLLIDNLLFNVGLSNPVKERRVKEKNKIIRIFLASSAELKDDRKEFEIFINRENINYIKQGIFIELMLWENFIDAISQTRLQDEYNKAVRDSDIFISLFFTKVGKFTAEEFAVAFGQFKQTNRPFVYTYFKSGSVNIDKVGEEINSKLAFERKLKKLGHFKTTYKSQADLQLKFKKQLEAVIPDIVASK